MDQASFDGVDGLRIFTRSWRPAAAPRAALVVVHGFNSHSGQYEWAAEQLAERGLAVHAVDLQGRGKSDGERFYVEKFDDYVANVATFVAMVRSRAPALPVFLLGHSAGGVVCCLYALEHQAGLAGLICESFAHELPAPDAALALLVRADERLEREFARITLPLLILHGTADRAAKPSGSRHLYERAGSGDKTLKLYQGHFHDLLNDLGREDVIADVHRWIDARL